MTIKAWNIKIHLSIHHSKSKNGCTFQHVMAIWSIISVLCGVLHGGTLLNSQTGRIKSTSRIMNGRNELTEHRYFLSKLPVRNSRVSLQSPKSHIYRLHSAVKWTQTDSYTENLSSNSPSDQCYCLIIHVSPLWKAQLNDLSGCQYRKMYNE